MRPFYFLSMLLALSACQRAPMHIKNSESIAIFMDSTWNVAQDTAYTTSLKPIKTQMEQELNIVIGLAPETMTATKPESLLSNWTADALRLSASQITGKSVDIGIVNMGGLRCDWPAGNITRRSVFELMPFDNEMSILTLKGETLTALCNCFAQVGGQGVSGLRMNIRKGKAQDITIGGKPLNPQEQYTVATSDYLAFGNDHMEPLANYTNRYDTGKRIRDIFIDFIEQKTAKKEPITSEMDGRITIIE